MGMCSVQGCGKDTLARGYCSVHYQRWYRDGQAEPDQALAVQTPLGGADAPPDVPAPLVALSPDQMPQAQLALAGWFKRKLARTREELADLKQNLLIADERGLDTAGWVRQERLARGRLDFYAKCHAAVSAGYLLIPNLPTEAFAVRTDAEFPWAEGEWPGRVRVGAKRLPPGEGRYVSPAPTIRDLSWTDSDKKTHRWYKAGEFMDVVFPVTPVKPAVLQAAGAAMGLRIFDELATVQAPAKRDPIIVGRVLHPVRTRSLTFFVAWWVDFGAL